MRFLFLVMVLFAVLFTPLLSRGDDDATRARKVRVALAIAASADAKVVSSHRPKLDWFVSTAAEIETAPAPKVVPCDAAANRPARPEPATTCDGCKCGPDCPCQCPSACTVGMSLESTPYRKVRAMVAEGKKVLMLVRPPAGESYQVRIGWITLRCDDAPMDAGMYSCELTNGSPQMLRELSWLTPMPSHSLADRDLGLAPETRPPTCLNGTCQLQAR